MSFGAPPFELPPEISHTQSEPSPQSNAPLPPFVEIMFNVPVPLMVNGTFLQTIPAV